MNYDDKADIIIRAKRTAAIAALRLIAMMMRRSAIYLHLLCVLTPQVSTYNNL